MALNKKNRHREGGKTRYKICREGGIENLGHFLLPILYTWLILANYLQNQIHPQLIGQWEYLFSCKTNILICQSVEGEFGFAKSLLKFVTCKGWDSMRDMGSGERRGTDGKE